MKTFKELSQEQNDLMIDISVSEAKFKKVKKWKADKKGNLKKVLVKQCQDSDGKKVAGYKVVGGKKCEKISPAELQTMKKTQKKIQKTKTKHSGKNKRRAELIQKKREAKGL